MTNREDAIDIIQSILNKYEEDECLVTEITIGDEDIKAFKMAIKALEQEPCEDATLKDIFCMGCEYKEPKTGHWIGHREHCKNLGVMPSGLGDYEWCSNCDCGIDVREWHRNRYNFCPNCGADMRADRSEE